MTAERSQTHEKETLRRPGPIGRVVRLVLAALSLDVVYAILTQPSAFVTGHALDAPAIWVMIAVGLWVFPTVVNIGFTKAWRKLALYTSLGVVAGVAALVSWEAYGHTVRPGLGVLVAVWLLYTYGHMGIAFLLAAILATPGCEMRSLPQLWALVSGKVADVRACPGVLTPIDRWEARRGAGRRES
jgi:hypothetical protein